MQLTIDNFDSAGARDYTDAIASDGLPQIRRVLNRPSEMSFQLLSCDAGFVVPAAGGRVLLLRADGVALFSGYISSTPEYQYLGWAEQGPAYRYVLNAVSDEILLDRKRLPRRPMFVNRTAGEVLKEITQAALPAAFDLASIADVETLTSYSADSGRPWSAHAAELALRTRACYRAHQGKITFQPLATTTHTVSESDAGFDPAALKLAAPDSAINDATVIGRLEPDAWVKDYFLGDGFLLGFNLSHEPFGGRSTLLDEEFAGPLNASVWIWSDPAQALAISAGKLLVNGGTGADGATALSLHDDVELGGALVLRHGEIEFQGPSAGILGGLYAGAITTSSCLAGFDVAPEGAQSRIYALVNGSRAGTSILTQPGWKYALSTHVFSSEAYRQERCFHSSQHVAGSARGGGAVPAAARVVIEVHAINPANPGTQASASTVLFDGTVANAPAYAIYAPVNARSMHVAVPFVRITRVPNVTVETTLPGQGRRIRLSGSIAEGAECRIATQTLWFHPEDVPAGAEGIRAAYRSARRSGARVTDTSDAAGRSRASDDGVRSMVRIVASPAPRTSTECEHAARALLDDSTKQAWAGEYSCWNSEIATADVLPGDGVNIDVPSRRALFTAIVREVVVGVEDLATDLSRYAIRFANDAAAPLSFRFDERASSSPDLVANEQFISDLPDAEVTLVDSVSWTINAGTTPPAGGGFEVRRSDFGWSQTYDRNLVGRFTTRTFAVDRLSRVQTLFVRQYDANSHYSRHSTALHVDYPL